MCHDPSRQVEPCHTAVENHRIGGDDDTFALLQQHIDPVGRHGSHGNVQPPRRFVDELRDSPAVGDGTVEKPERLFYAKLFDRFGGQFDRFFRLFAKAVTAVDVGDVADAAIDAADQDAAAQGCFEGDEEIEAVDADAFPSSASGARGGRRFSCPHAAWISAWRSRRVSW